jgi:hypothetical protein
VTLGHIGSYGSKMSVQHCKYMHKYVTFSIKHKKMEILVNIYKNWLDDVKVGTMSMEEFMEIENNLVEEMKMVWVKLGFWKWMIRLMDFKTCCFVFGFFKAYSEGGSLGYKRGLNIFSLT